MTDLTHIIMVVDKICEHHLPPRVSQRGRPHIHSTPFILQLAAVQYLHGFASESAFLRWLAKHPHNPFRRLPSRSQYNRRMKQLSKTMTNLLPLIAREVGVKAERIRIIDSAPVPVVSFGVGDRSRCFPRGRQINFGFCAAKKQRYYGCKLHLVTSKLGVPLYYELGPANEHDVRRLLSLGEWLRPGTWLLGDKGYLSHWRRDYLKAGFGVFVLTPARKNHGPDPAWMKRLLRKRRGNIETTFSQLKEQMGLERLGAKSYRGLEARVAACLFAYAVGVRFNVRYHRPMRALKSILT